MVTIHIFTLEGQKNPPTTKNQELLASRPRSTVCSLGNESSSLRAELPARGLPGLGPLARAGLPTAARPAQPRREVVVVRPSRLGSSR